MPRDPFILLLIPVLVVACEGAGTTRDSDRAVVSAASSSPANGSQVNLLPVDDSIRLIEHSDVLPAGFPSVVKPLLVKNPYEGSKDAITTGAKLFIAYNCLDCHGAEGSGAMGPSFQDGRWHFGGTAGEVFESIYQGRPDGMPSWGGRITNDQIWMLTAYVRSLSSKDLSTENFSGKTVERTGH
jgi:cytochrome c oxidase cbb3-type subunit 3